MKKLVVILTSISLVFWGGLPSNAEDAYNPDALPAPEGTGTFLIGEDGASIHFSTLTADKNNREAPAVCEAVTDPECSRSKVDYISANSVLKVCSSRTDTNCVVRLELAGEDGVFQPATYVRNIQGMKFPANAATGYMGGTTPSLWSAPQVPSASGTTDYAVIVRVESWMDWSTGRFRSSGLVASVRPYREVTGNYESAYQFVTESNHLGKRGFALGGHGYECAWSETGACGILQDFAPNTRVKLTVRVTSQIGGWFKGRIKNPLISVTQPISGMNEITVEAAPAEVNRMFYQTDIATLSSKEKEYARRGLAGSLENGFTHWAQASDSFTFSYLDYLRPKMLDTSSGVTTMWNFATSGESSNNNCLADTSKVLGIVTTNAMAYDGGVPKFQNGFLNYQVAGLHYQPDGLTEVQGSYDLVIRSEVARCLYGFSQAPLSATISVTGKGSKTIATTIVSEKNGWLKLAAYGFTFSKKTIKVKVVKAKPKKKKKSGR